MERGEVGRYQVQLITFHVPIKVLPPHLPATDAFPRYWMVGLASPSFQTHCRSTIRMALHCYPCNLSLDHKMPLQNYAITIHGTVAG